MSTSHREYDMTDSERRALRDDLQDWGLGDTSLVREIQITAAGIAIEEIIGMLRVHAVTDGDTIGGPVAIQMEVELRSGPITRRCDQTLSDLVGDALYDHACQTEGDEERFSAHVKAMHDMVDRAAEDARSEWLT